MRLLLSRTDSIGDVILTLPMAGLIKKVLPGTEIHFLGRTYTDPIARCSENIDHFHNYDDLEKLGDKEASEVIDSWNIDTWIHVFPVKRIANLVKRSGIKNRIGATGRLYHWLTCNKLVRISRKKSELHESQLNIKLLRPLGIKEDVALGEMSDLASFTRILSLSDPIKSILDPDKFNVILHPKSKGSAVEWGLENFADLMNKLNDDSYRIIITGTAADATAIGSSLPFENKNVINLLDKLSLEDLIALITQSNGLVAASTGPLHIAGVSNKLAIGLFSSRRPIHPGRWSPIGKYSTALTNDIACPNCVEGEACVCISRISPIDVIKKIEAHRSLFP